MNAAIRIEPAGREAASDAIRIIQAVYRDYGFLWPSAESEVPDLLDFDRHYAPPYGGFFVARVDEQIGACVGIERTADGAAEIHRLYMDPALRGRGIGGLLVAAVMQWCREQAIPRIVLWTDSRFTHAHALYEWLGFVRGTPIRVPNDVNASREYWYERAL